MSAETNGPRSLVTGNRPLVTDRSASAFRAFSLVLWSGAAFFLSLLLLRFGMRALGVRPDIAFPGFVYGLTDWLVQPLYRFFPLPVPYGARFDTPVIETASLGAVGVVIAVALGVYVVGLLLFHLQARRP